MRNGRFHPPKCKGNAQKTGEKILKGLFSSLLLLDAHFFGLMWWIHGGWLKYMPALPKLLVKTSETHNF
jgi:hypothetical protein